MSVVTRQKFISGLAKSGVLSEEVLQRWQKEVSAESDAVKLAKDLIAKELLTSWQAKMILKGAHKLSIGNYLLTERLGKSDLGDYFAAFHPQLSRNVSIQYLTADLSRDPETRKKLFSLGSKLSELDHPNLLHVFDVDEEGDRIYLVSEVGHTTSLVDHLSQNSSLTCPEVAKLLHGALKGVQYAHSCGVVHSGISLKSMFVKPNGDAKIGELTRFAVSNSLAENSVGPETDFEALSQVARSVIGHVPVDQRETQEFATLRDSIRLLVKDREAAEVGLGPLAASHVVSSDVLDSDVLLVVEGEVDVAAEDPAFEFGSQEAVPLRSVAATRKAPVASQSTSAPVKSPDSGSFLKQNRVAVIAGGVAALLLLLGGGVTAALMSGDSTGAAAQVSGFEKDAGPSLLSEDSGGAGEASIDPEANRRAIEAMFESKGGSSSEATDTVSGKAKPEERKPRKRGAAEDAMSEPEVAAEDLDDSKAAVAKKDEPTEAVANTDKDEDRMVVAKSDDEPEASAERAVEADEEVVSEPKVAKKPKPKPTQDLKKGENPFAKFAKSVDLPGLEATDQVSFGKLVLEKRHLLGAEILSATNAHRNKPIFTMERSADDRQSWDIGFKANRRKPPTSIAKLQKTSTELKFSWLPGAVETPVAEALRNCRIKLSTPANSHWLSLRKPIRIEGFQLSKKSGEVEVEVEIPNLPAASAISGTLTRMAIRVDRKKRERLLVEPAEVMNSVARMHLTEDRDRFISLDVSCSARKSLKLRAALVFQPDPLQRPTVIRDPSKLNPQYTNPIRQLAQQARAQADQVAAKLEAMVAKQSRKKRMSERDQDAYKKPSEDAAKIAEGKAQLTGLYDSMVPRLLDKEIPVAIVYVLNGQHRIVLAYSGAVEGVE